jgi:hypothetical protein
MTESAATDWKADVREAARLLIRRSWLLGLAPLIAAGLTALALTFQPARFSANALVAGGAQVPAEALAALAMSAEMERRLSAELDGGAATEVAASLHAGGLEALDGGLTRLTLSAASAQRAVALTRAWATNLVSLIAEIYPDRTSAGGENAPRVVSLPNEAFRADVRFVPKVLTAAVLGLMAGAVVILNYRVAKPRL